MIKNIIFDLGNVVLKLKWEIVLNKFSDNDSDKNLLEEVIFNSEEWKELDNGTIEKADAIEIMISKLPEKLHKPCREIMASWREGLVINDNIINFIENVRKQGYKTYVLSNAPHEIPEYLTQKNLDKYFDGQIISAQEKVSKPNPKIYEILLNRYSLNPEESLFLDDKKENIDTAINCKINGYVFDYNDFKTFLDNINEKYNIEIK